MFTGIVEEIGIIKSVVFNSSSAKLEIGCSKVLNGINLGDSISIDGVCETVIEYSKDFFCVQVSNETLNVTKFRNLKKGLNVNLERALTLAKRLGGHLVTGHIDTTAKLIKKDSTGNFCNLFFELPNEYLKYVVKKGSISIDGVSLTISEIRNNIFGIATIPHTLINTTLKSINVGDMVNVEVDILAKYIENFLSTNNNKVIDENFLIENGF